MKKATSSGLMLTILFFLGIAIYIVAPILDTRLDYSDVFYLFAAILPVFYALAALPKFKSGSTEKTSLWILTLGFLGTFLGESIWFYYENFSDIFPFPSVADFFFISFYPLAFWVLIRELKKSGMNINKEIDTKDYTLFGFAALFALVVAYFGVYLAIDSEATFLENLVGVSYGIADLLLIVLGILVIKMALSYRKKAISYMWMSFFLGLLTLLAADVTFAIFTDLYEEGARPISEIIDLLWIAHFLFFAYSAELMRVEGTMSAKAKK